LASEVEGHVHAEPIRRRDGIDEMPKRYSTGQLKIDPTTEIVRQDRFARHPVDRTGKGGRIEPGRIDQTTTADGDRLVPANVEVETVVANPAGQHWGSEYDHCAGRLRLSLKSHH